MNVINLWLMIYVEGVGTYFNLPLSTIRHDHKNADSALELADSAIFYSIEFVCKICDCLFYSFVTPLGGIHQRSGELVSKYLVYPIQPMGLERTIKAFALALEHTHLISIIERQFPSWGFCELRNSCLKLPYPPLLTFVFLDFFTRTTCTI